VLLKRKLIHPLLHRMKCQQRDGVTRKQSERYNDQQIADPLGRMLSNTIIRHNQRRGGKKQLEYSECQKKPCPNGKGVEITASECIHVVFII